MTFAKAIDSAHTHNLDLVKLFDQAPILLCPTVAGQTAVVGRQGTVNGVETPFWAPFTGAYNLTRNPAGTVPVGFTADGMPVGLQVIGPQHADVAVLRTIAVFEEDPGTGPAGAPGLSAVRGHGRESAVGERLQCPFASRAISSAG